MLSYSQSELDEAVKIFNEWSTETAPRLFKLIKQYKTETKENSKSEMLFKTYEEIDHLLSPIYNNSVLRKLFNARLDYEQLGFIVRITKAGYVTPFDIILAALRIMSGENFDHIMKNMDEILIQNLGLDKDYDDE